MTEGVLMQDAAKLQKRLNTAKSTILLIGALTIINTVLIAFNADVVFTFSAYVPQFVTWLFMDIAADLQVKRYLYIGIAMQCYIMILQFCCMM